MKTKNVWVIAAAHFFNNNLGMWIVPAALIEDEKNALLIGAAYIIVYFPFLLAKEYRGVKDA